MFEFDQIIELLKVEPGHGMTQSVLLFMIWWSSRGVKKEIASLKKVLDAVQAVYETRFSKIEGRISALEATKGGKE